MTRGRPLLQCQIPLRALPSPLPSKRVRRQTNTQRAAAKSARQTLPACPHKSVRCRSLPHCSDGRPFCAALLSASLLLPRPRLPPPRIRRQSFPPSSRLRAPTSASFHNSESSRWCARWWPAPRAVPRASSLRFLRTGPFASDIHWRYGHSCHYRGAVQ